MTKRKSFNENELGIRLRNIRHERNLTQLELAGKLFVTRSAVANWESGFRYPKFEEVKRLSVFFGVPMDYFYGMTDYRYNVKQLDHFRLDLTMLNDAGLDMIREYFEFLVSNPKYSNQEENNQEKNA